MKNRQIMEEKKNIRNKQKKLRKKMTAIYAQ